MNFISKLILSLVLMSSLMSCFPNYKKGEATVDSHEKDITHLLAFFNDNAFQPEFATYYSEIDDKGQPISQKVYTVALSRLIYGLSYSSSIDTSYLVKAELALSFLLKNLVAYDSIGVYFKSYIDMQSGDVDNSTQLDIWQQAYGLCGLTEFYRNHPSAELLSFIHQAHDAFISRFHDPMHGGFYGNSNKNTGQISGSKSLQALLYPITAYMENLWLADSLHKAKYELYLKENINLAYKNGWDDKRGWVTIKFDDSWTSCKHKSVENICFTVNPGHNFQFASVLLRTNNWMFLTSQEQFNYHKLGLDVLKRTLTKPIYPANDLSLGFYSEVNPLTNEVLDFRKTWWQHCEALIALSLADGKFEKELVILENYYFSSFPDTQNGGEYFYLDKANIPQTTELKGSIGKSAYHTVEMIRYLTGRNQFFGSIKNEK